MAHVLLNMPSMASWSHSPLGCCLAIMSRMAFSIGFMSGYSAESKPMTAYAVCTTWDPLGCSMYLICRQPYYMVNMKLVIA